MTTSSLTPWHTERALNNLTPDDAVRAALTRLPSYARKKEAKIVAVRAAFIPHLDELLTRREAGWVRYTRMILEDLEALAWKKATKTANAILRTGEWFG